LTSVDGGEAIVEIRSVDTQHSTYTNDFQVHHIQWFSYRSLTFAYRTESLYFLQLRLSSPLWHSWSHAQVVTRPALV